jgi:UDP-N-acetylmuramoyl-L-alanyl-D-glutamate--2,6-diaminopimelate ligase
MLPELAVFTNLAPEHLGRHGTLERYGVIKRRLFINDGIAVARAIVDVDGPFGRDLAADIERHGGAVTRVGFSAAADYRVESAHWDLREAETRLVTPAGAISLRTALPGDYNARNVAAAVAIADLTGVERWISIPALSAYVGPPGRFEHIDVGQPFEVIVDFAHTPDALEQLLATIRAGMRPGAQLRVVFGLGGAPGTALREMGSVARRSSDELILTTSGFRGSPPVLTLESILTGARTAAGAELVVVLDRRRAIERAVLNATAGDVILIPGRGAFTHMHADARGEPVAFDDREVAREVLRASRHRAARLVVPQSLTATPRRFSTGSQAEQRRVGG